MNNTVDRLKKYYQDPNNSSVISYIKGINPQDQKVILEKNGQRVSVSMDELEGGMFDFNTFSLKQVTPVQPEPQVVPAVPVQPQMPEATSDTIVMAPPVESEPETLEELHMEEPKKESKMTLNDLKTLAELNNKETLDKALKEFASNPQTGEVDMNKAISIIISNTVEEVSKAIMNNQVLPSELYKYDLTGKLIMPIEEIISGEAA